MKKLLISILAALALPVLGADYAKFGNVTLTGGGNISGTEYNNYSVYTNTSTYLESLPAPYPKNVFVSRDGNVMYVTGNGAMHYSVSRSYDHGTNWVAIDNDDGGILTGSTNGQYIVNCDPAGSYLVIKYSTDYGTNWANSLGSSLYGYHYRSAAASADGSKVYVLATDRKLLKSTDYAANFVEQAGAQMGQGIACDSTGQYVVLGTGSGIYYSSDSGANFTLSGEVSGPWYTFTWSADDSRVYAVPQSGVVKYSTDRGVTWTATGSASLSWFDLACNATGKKVLATTLSEVYASEDYGATWSVVYAGGSHSIGGNAAGSLFLLEENGNYPNGYTRRIECQFGKSTVSGVDLVAAGSILPNASNAYNIGSAAMPFHHGYFAEASLFVGTQAVSQAAVGSWNQSTQAISTLPTNNWNTAYGWGNHAAVGYASTNSVNAVSNRTAIVESQTNGWNTSSAWVTGNSNQVLKADGSVPWAGAQNAGGTILTNLGGFWIGGVLVTNIDTQSVVSAETAIAVDSNRISAIEVRTNTWNTVSTYVGAKSNTWDSALNAAAVTNLVTQNAVSNGWFYMTWLGSTSTIYAVSPDRMYTNKVGIFYP